MKNIDKVIAEAKVKANINNYNRIFFPHLSWEKYLELFFILAQEELKIRNNTHLFVMDKHNESIIHQLFYYITGDKDKFKGNMLKGLFMLGNFGTGKSIILISFYKLFNALSDIKKFTYVRARDLGKLIISNEKDYFNVRPLFIDDIGKEDKMISDFGTQIYPIIDTIDARYNGGAWTLATANFNLNSFKKFYGETISERMIEMFNFFELTGKSRRR